MKVRVRDVMTSDVVTIEPDTPLKEAAVIMGRHRVSGLPVVEGGTLVGIITESDFVSRMADDDVGLMDVLFRSGEPKVSGSVGEAMSADPITIGADEQVVVAARLMTRHQVKRLPVVDGPGRLVGVVSRADLMRVFARPDADIAADIRRGGVEGLLAADGDAVGITVTEGVVQLAGTVGSVTEKRMLEEFSRQVAGVVRVDSDLAASFDDTRLPPM